MKLSELFFLGVVAWIGVAGVVSAQESASGKAGEKIVLYPEKPYLHVMHDGRSVKVQRVQDPSFQLQGYYARTGRNCPPFCLQPASAGEGVKTIGEREVFEFMEDEVRNGEGLLVDARTPSWFKKGTIPGSVNIPFTTLSKPVSDPEMVTTLTMLGAVKRGEVGAMTRTMEEWGLMDAEHKTADWDFSAAKELILWCNGPACGQSPRAIRGLLAVGYPADKLRYYRGGMQLWQLFGLSTVAPN